MAVPGIMVAIFISASMAMGESVKAKIRMYFLIMIIFLVKLLSKLPINV